jgi:glyoxylase-like metal-dependent hydrolase (beta-lactamase superfamily II)
MRVNKTWRIATWILLWSTPLVTSAQDAPRPPVNAKPAGRVRSVRVTVLSTMLTDAKGVGEWGFAALVEADGHRLLFDTGARPETVLRNAQELGINLTGVTDVVLSHHHGDHTGGLLTLRRELMKQNTRALSRVYVGSGLFLSRPGVMAARRTRSSRGKARTKRWEAPFLRWSSPPRSSPVAG